MSKLDPKDVGGDGEKSHHRINPRLVLIGVLAAALGLFVVQNTDDVPVNWLFFEFTAPLWIVLLATAALALILGEAAGALRKRSRRSDDKKK